MTDNENKKTPEELTAEILDALGGGLGGSDLTDTAAAFGAQFLPNNCWCCKYDSTAQCRYYPMGPAGAFWVGLDACATCPGLAVE